MMMRRLLARFLPSPVQQSSSEQVTSATPTTPQGEVSEEMIDTAAAEGNARPEGQVAEQPVSLPRPMQELTPTKAANPQVVMVVSPEVKVTVQSPESRLERAIRVGVKLAINTGIPVGTMMAIRQNIGHDAYQYGRDAQVGHLDNPCPAGMGNGWYILGAAIAAPVIGTFLDEANYGPSAVVEWSIEKIKAAHRIGQRSLLGLGSLITGTLGYSAGPLVALLGLADWMRDSGVNGCDLGYHDAGNFSEDYISTPVAAVILASSCVLTLGACTYIAYREGIKFSMFSKNAAVERLAQAQMAELRSVGHQQSSLTIRSNS